MAGLPDTLPASTVMNLNVIENFLRRHRHADIIEAVVDTTWANGAVVPFLNLWAWKRKLTKMTWLSNLPSL